MQGANRALKPLPKGSGKKNPQWNFNCVTARTGASRNFMVSAPWEPASVRLSASVAAARAVYQLNARFASRLLLLSSLGGAISIYFGPIDCGFLFNLFCVLRDARTRLKSQEIIISTLYQQLSPEIRRSLNYILQGQTKGQAESCDQVSKASNKT
jgi:hypothetical protein